jgi:hypothetical protein
MNDDTEPEELPPLSYVPTVLDAELFPDDVAAWAVSVTPGSAVVTALALLDPARMSHEGRVDALAAWDRQAAWSQARQDRFLAAMADDPTVPALAGELDKEWVREEVACALRLSSGHAANRLRVAKELAGRLADTLDLQERGEITSHHSRSLAEATMPLDQVTASKVEEAVLPKAPDQALASFRRCVKTSPEARRRLDTQTTRRRLHRMDVPDRAQVRRTGSDLSDRTNQRTSGADPAE